MMGIDIVLRLRELAATATAVDCRLLDCCSEAADEIERLQVLSADRKADLDAVVSLFNRYSKLVGEIRTRAVKKQAEIERLRADNERLRAVEARALALRESLRQASELAELRRLHRRALDALLAELKNESSKVRRIGAEDEASKELETLTPPNADLLALADRHPAPPEWWEEEEGA